MGKQEAIMTQREGNEPDSRRPVAVMAPCTPVLTGLINAFILSATLWTALGWAVLLLR
jgi:hypothetical protein